MTEDQFISFETAKLAKDKGFNIETIKSWDIISSKIDTNKRASLRNTDVGYEQMPIQVHDRYYAPTQTSLQTWLREKYDIYVYAFMSKSSGYGFDKAFYFEIKMEFNNMMSTKIVSNKYDDFAELYKDWLNSYASKTYEDALEEGLYNGLKLIELALKKNSIF